MMALNINHFDTCISWIDTIVSMCKNLDNICNKLDGLYPSDNDMNQILWLRGLFSKGFAIDPRVNLKTNCNCNASTLSEELDTEGFAYDNVEDSFMLRNVNGCSSTTASTSNSPLINNNADFKNNETTTKKRLYINDGVDRKNEDIKQLERGAEMIVIKRRKKKSSSVSILKVTDAYDYLLDIPWFSQPDPDKGVHQYKCAIPGVYWDKRSWIASWYREGRRFYSSFSAKLHGFYKSKYYAIQVRLYNTMYSNNTRKRNDTFKRSYEEFCKEVT